MRRTVHVKSISGTVTMTVVLGEGNYGDELTITKQGAVIPNDPGATGIYAPPGLARIRIDNQGAVLGAPGGSASHLPGGLAIDLGSVASLNNSGSIVGGYGPGDSQVYMDTYSGGDGVLLSAGGDVSNSGTILGGNARYGVYGGGAGGIAIDLTATGTLANTGFIGGGNSGRGPNYGGNAVDFVGGVIHNQGSIVGGYGGSSGSPESGVAGNGGLGIDIAGVGILVNHGSIVGGAGGDAAVFDAGGAGGAGVDMLFGGVVINHGSISGGVGGSASYGGPGGVGLDLSSGSIFNKGTIAGGFGGNGGGSGGTGVLLGNATSLTNIGTILGGTATEGDRGGNGGAGVEADGSAVIIDRGSIMGGAGGQAAQGHGGNGGAGVFLAAGTLAVSGKVSGGSGASGNYGNGIAGPAVQFGGTAATLEITANAIFGGDIVANAAVDDSLTLDPKGSGTLSGFGTSVTGFTTINEAANARWTLSGIISGTGSIEIGGGATLTLDGTVSISTLAFGSVGNETLRLEKPVDFTSSLSGFGAGDTIFLSGIEATSLIYAGHSLTLFDASGTAVDTLTFDGRYIQADFGLDAVQSGTNLIFARAEMAPNDFLHPTFGPPPYEPLAGAGGLPFATGFRQAPEDTVMLHFGHVLPL
jgi:hypothetical protein